VSSTVEILIAGAGLSGACAALWLSETHHVTLVTGTAPAASRIAAGLVNPFAGMRMCGFQNADMLLNDLTETLKHAEALHTYNPCGILRPANNQRQASNFQTQSVKNPLHIRWLSPDQVKADHPFVSAPLGAAITTGGILDTPEMLDRILNSLQGSIRVIQANITSWKDMDSHVTVTLNSGQIYKSQRLILALGPDYISFPELHKLHLHRIKGQLVYIHPPDFITVSLPICGSGYVVPEPNRWILGTTYDHSPCDVHPTSDATKKILGLTKKMIPSIDSSAIIDVTAGIRVGVPGTRLPMVGPLTENVWILTGLGSRGLLLASHIGRNLPTWMNDIFCIPQKFRVRNN